MNRLWRERRRGDLWIGRMSVMIVNVLERFPPDVMKTFGRQTFDVDNTSGEFCVRHVFFIGNTKKMSKNGRNLLL